MVAPDRLARADSLYRHRPRLIRIQVSLARTLSGELIGRGIRVNAVSPGPVATPLHDKLGLQGDSLNGLVKQIPLGRRGHPDEVAQAIVFLASDGGAFTVGSEFIIDGGMSTL